MMLKTRIGVAQDYTGFNYGPLILQKYLKPQDRTIVEGPGMNPATRFVLPGHRKEKVIIGEVSKPQTRYTMTAIH